MIVTDKLSTESFHAFIDEQLTDDQYAQVEAQLDEIPEKIEEIQQCHIVNERLREVFDPIVEEPLPEDLYDLALYGLERESEEQPEMFENTPMSYQELEEDIAALESLNIFPETEEVEGESLADDTDISDLELLAQTEHLSDFDIDELRNDSGNIIPDIFDVEEESAVAAEADQVSEAEYADPTDDLLESIDELSIELEKTHHSNKGDADDGDSLPESEMVDETQVDESQVNVAEILENEELELEPLPESTEDELSAEATEQSHLPLDESTSVEAEEAIDENQLSAQEEILETLSSEDELTLEPLDDQSSAAFIQQSEQLEPELPVTQDPQKKSQRPRNLRADRVTPEHDPAQYEQESASLQDDLFKTLQDTEESQRVPSNEEGSIGLDFNEAEAGDNNNFELPGTSASEEKLPDDLVAEFFSENKGADFEVNEVVKQFEEVSQDFSALDDSHLFDDGSAAGFKQKLQVFVYQGQMKVNEFKAVFARKKSELLSKFGGGDSNSDFNFNNSPFGDSSFVQSPTSVSKSTDTLDISAFDDFAREASLDNNSETKDSNGFQSRDEYSDAVPTAERFADDFPGEKLAQAAKQDDAELFAGINEVSVEENTLEPDQGINTSTKATVKTKQKPQDFTEEKPFETASTVGTDFDLDMEFDESSENGNLVSKFGDTLKHYKQKIAEMRANPAESVDEEISVMDKLKNITTRTLGNLQSKRLQQFGFIAVLVVVVIVAGLLFVGGGAGKAISNDKLEALAIDTHLLNLEFNKKMIADADSAIIEKLQWFSARVGHQVRLGDIKVEDFEFKKVTVIPTMASFAAANIFENKAGQRMTLLVIPDLESQTEAPLSCRIPAEIDGLCVWVKDSVRYIVVANLSLSRVRSFSEQVAEKL